LQGGDGIYFEADKVAMHSRTLGVRAGKTSIAGSGDSFVEVATTIDTTACLFLHKNTKNRTKELTILLNDTIDVSPI